MNTMKKTSGLALAIAAASMMGCANTQSASSQATSQASSQTPVHCYGVNKCNGHNDCKTAENACKGQGSCKGQGFISMLPKACADVGGTVGA